MEKEEIEKLTKEYQSLQMQLQSLSMQKLQFSQQNEEYKDAEKELNAAMGHVYVDIGGLMVETTKQDALIKLNERLESTQMRISIVTRQYEEATKKEQILRLKLTEELKGAK